MSKNKRVIAVGGQMRSGKDLVGEIIQYLTSSQRTRISFEEYQIISETDSPYRIKKFAYKVKLIASIMLGIPLVDFEKREVKDMQLGEQWDRWSISTQHETLYFTTKELAENACGGYYKAKRHTYTVRSFLQTLSTEAIRERLHPAAWSNILFQNYTENSHWIITDLRLPEEEQSVQKVNGISIIVHRPLQKRYPEELKQFEKEHGTNLCTEEAFIEWLLEKEEDSHLCKLGRAMSHFSERNVRNIKPTHVIKNSTDIEYLVKTVERILISENIVDEIS